MFFQVEVLWRPVDVQTNQDLPVLVAVVAEHNVPLVASCQKLLRDVQPVLLGLPRWVWVLYLCSSLFPNLVRWMGIEPTTDCFRGNRPYLMGYQRMCVVYIIVAGQSRLFSKHLPNTIQDEFNYCVTDHNFIVV